MISSAKTLFLATLVFNAATVFGAPIRNVDTGSESVARAETSTSVRPIPRADIVDVEDNRRRSRLGHITRRSARLVSERDEPLPEAVVVREPAPVVDVVAPIVKSRERHYPRRALHERHEKPKPAITVLGTTMVPAPDVKTRERRYPRRALHARHEKREPATSIKETTTVVEKITVLDTPEDALAFNANKPDSSASSTVSTLVSISATTTLAPDSSVPTAAPTDSVSATDSVTATDSVSASSTASSASATASSDATSTTDSVSATATPTASSTSSATDSTITASPTSTASTGDPTASASSTSSADGAEASPPAGGDPITVITPSRRADPDVRRGIYIRASTEPILRRVAFSGASWASSVRRQLSTH